MGIVHAKEPEHSENLSQFSRQKVDDDTRYKDSRAKKQSAEMKETWNSAPQESSKAQAKSFNLQKIKARVDKIHVDGLGRTKDDIVKAQVRELFMAENFQDVILRASKAQRKLESLGCFKNIGVSIDVSEGPDATPEGVEVTFDVRETRRFIGGVNTMVGNNEGSAVIEGKAPNLFGRGEQLQLVYSYGTKSSSNINISAVKPFVDNRLNAVLTGSIFTTTADYSWSGFKQLDSGMLLDLALNPNGLGSLKHNFQYEGVYRNISASKQASFTVREQCGPSLKSALRHICSIDKRNEAVFPTSGSLVKFTTEVAGLGGDIGFVKNELALQTNWTIFDNFTFQLGLQSGLLRGISNDLKINIADRFFLGGPMNVRGFDTRGVGPRRDGNAIGGDFFWAIGLHLYTPLPFRPSFGDSIRLHGFVNTGSLSDNASKLGYSYKENMSILAKDVRVSAGGGIAIKLGNVVRVELNLVMPFKYIKHDPLHQFQFGFGVEYL